VGRRGDTIKHTVATGETQPKGEREKKGQAASWTRGPSPVGTKTANGKKDKNCCLNMIQKKRKSTRSVVKDQEHNKKNGTHK